MNSFIWTAAIQILVGFITVVDSADPVILPLDRGIRSSQQSDFVPLLQIPNFAINEAIMSRSNQSFTQFHHGEPKWSKLAGIESENWCYSFVRTEFSLGLICREIIYLLDSSTYARQFMQNLGTPILEFTTFEGKILMVTKNIDPASNCTLTIHLLDTFDQRLDQLPCLLEGRMTGGFLRAVHLKLSTKSSPLMFYETSQHTLTGVVPCWNPTILFVPIDRRGVVNPNSQIALQLHQLVDADGKQLIRSNSNVSIVEVFQLSNQFHIFYHEDTNTTIKGLTVDIDQTSDEFGLIPFSTRPIIFENTSFPKSFMENRTVWGIPNTNFFVFYQLKVGELIICSIGKEDGKSETRILGCSNTYLVWLDDRAPSRYLIQGFARSLYLSATQIWMLHVEIKSREADNRTIYSTLLEFQEKNLALREITSWKVGGSKYHFLLSSGTPSDVKKYELIALKRHSFISYRSTMSYIQLDYSTLLRTSPPVDADGYVSASVKFYRLDSTRTNFTEKEYVLKLRVRLVENYCGLVVPTSPAIPLTILPKYIRSSDTIDLPLSDLNITGTSLRYELNPVALPEGVEFSTGQDQIVRGFLFSDTLEDVVILDVKPDLDVADIRFEGSYLIVLSKWYLRLQLTKGYIYWCHPDFYISTESESKTKLSCHFLRSFSVGVKVTLQEAFDLNKFLVVRLQADNSVIYAKFDKIEFSCVVLDLKGYSPSKVAVAEHNINTLIVAQYRKNRWKSFILFQITGEQIMRLPDLALDPFFSSEYTSWDIPYFGLWSTKDGVELQLIMDGTNSFNFATFKVTPNQAPTRTGILTNILANKNPVEICMLPNRIVYARKAALKTAETCSSDSFSQCGSEGQTETIIVVYLWIVDSISGDIQKFYRLPDEVGLDQLTDILELSCVPHLNLVNVRLSRLPLEPNGYRFLNLLINADIDVQATESVHLMLGREGNLNDIGTGEDQIASFDCRTDWLTNYGVKICNMNSAINTGYYTKIPNDSPMKIPRDTRSSFELTFWRPLSPRAAVSVLYKRDKPETALVKVKITASQNSLETQIAWHPSATRSLIRRIEWSNTSAAAIEQLLSGKSDDLTFNLTTDDTFEPTVEMQGQVMVKMPRFTEELHHLHFQLVKKSDYSSSSAFCYSCEPKPTEISNFVNLRSKLEFVGHLIKPNIWANGILGWNSAVQVNDVLFVLSSYSREHLISSRLSIVQTKKRIPEHPSGQDLKEAGFGLEVVYEKDLGEFYCGQMDTEQTPYIDDGLLILVRVMCLDRSTSLEEQQYAAIQLEFVRNSDGKISVLEPYSKKKQELAFKWSPPILSMQFGYLRAQNIVRSLFYQGMLYCISLTRYADQSFAIGVTGIQAFPPLNGRPTDPFAYQIRDWGPRKSSKI